MKNADKKTRLTNLANELKKQLNNMPAKQIKKPPEVVAQEILDKTKNIKSSIRRDKKQVLEKKSKEKKDEPSSKHLQVIAYYVATSSLKKTSKEFGCSEQTVKSYVDRFPHMYNKFLRIHKTSMEDLLENIVKKSCAEIDKRLTTTPNYVKVATLSNVMSVALDKLWKVQGKADKVVKFEGTDDIKSILDEITSTIEDEPVELPDDIAEQLRPEDKEPNPTFKEESHRP